MPKHQDTPLDPAAQARAQVAKDLGQGGVLDQRLPGYEERPAQILMAEAVATALVTGEHTLIEAATGTGKSLAYLLPIVRSDKVALVATANKALQEQLFYKDIPFIAAHVQPVRAALIKGMGNYLCLNHLDAERTGLQAYAHQPAFDELLALTNDDDFDGDLDMVEFALPADLRRRVAADSDDCAWRSCPFFGGCYVRKMREAAQTAQIVVINHTLLLIDVLMEGWLLPDRDVIVIDEAHHLEEEASRAFTVTVSPRRVETLLSQQRLREHCTPERLEAAITANVMAWSRLAEVTRFGNRSRALLEGPLEEGLRLAGALSEVGSSLRSRRPETMDEKEEQLYDKLTSRVANLVADLRLVFGVTDPAGRVYYVEREPARRGREGMMAVSAAPLSVTEVLKEKLFDRISVIATSATLAINNNFDFYRRRVGVSEAKELVLPYAFDYHTHALLYVPRLKYEPVFGKDSGLYLDELASQMRELVQASRGRAFLLFTSQRTLQEVWSRLEEPLLAEDFTLLLQGGGYARAELLRQFRTSERAVLFGLRSFWEGVDVVGEALSLVAIDKLPFDPPDDPVHEARVNQMRAAGENWFGQYVLPQAILRLKQGVGRLLRTRDDRGVLAILDSRLLTKGYGRQVIFALPPARRTVNMADVRTFFAAEDAADDDG
jgi:Rad3-related DNA helicase